MSIGNWRHGFYSRNLPLTTTLPTPLLPAHLADHFQGMAEACLTLAERLDAHAAERNGQVGRAVSTLTRLAADLEQFSALLRTDGLRPSALGNLPSPEGDHLIAQQRRALELSLSRIHLVTGALLSGEPLRPDGKGVETYRRLATLMRESKGIAKALASNLYWLQQQQDRPEADLAARLYAALPPDQEAE